MTYNVLRRGTDSNVYSYVVSNRPDNWDESERRPWPWLAEFPVNVGNGEDAQLQRAREYRDYLNSHLPLPPIGHARQPDPKPCSYCDQEKGHAIGCPAD